MRLYIDNTGPLITYRNRMFRVADLNPSNEIEFRMSRLEMLGLAWRCLRAAMWA